MLTVLLVIQVMIAIAMIALILFQQSSSDGLGGIGGGGGGGGGSLMSTRASANLLTRATAILATLFMVNSLAMATIVSRSKNSATTVIDRLEQSEQPATTTTTPATEDLNLPLSGETKPQEESAPSVPLAE